MRYHLTILFGLLTAVMASTQALAERRVALVVGNSHYANTVELRNPDNDAQDIAAKLKQLGFEVMIGLDLDQRDFARKIEEFGRVLDGADVGLFFYAGHGVQVNEHNYLVSTGAKLESEFLVSAEAIEVDGIVRMMEARAGTNIVFLDACRNNPLAENLRRSTAGSRSVAVSSGLAKVTPNNRDTLIAFSAAPGQTASDGSGRNSPFTTALLKYIGTPNLEVSVMLKEVAGDVRTATQNGQRPQQVSDMARTFFFSKQDIVAAPPSTDTDRSVEVAIFQSAIVANDCESVRSYLTRFPNGTFADFAKLSEQRLCAVKAVEPPKQVAVATPIVVPPKVVPAAPAVAPPKLIAVVPAPSPVPAPIAAPSANPAPSPAAAAPPAKVAALPPANTPAPPPPTTADVAKTLQTELIRVGCGTSLKANGDWDSASQSALRLFNRFAKTNLSSPGNDAVASVHSHDGRVCPLSCGRGMHADGETCVATPSKRSPSHDADESPPPSRRNAARPRPSSHDSDEAPPSRRNAVRTRPDPSPSRGRDTNFAPEGGQQRGTRANNAISETPFTSGGMKCHTLDVAGLAPHIVCP